MRMTSLQDRVTIGQLADGGCHDREIAARLGWQVRTVRKWRRRGRLLGPAGWVSPLGRPRRGALSSFSPQVEVALRSLRTAHPGWGPVTLRLKALQEGHLAGLRLPSAAAIARWLHEQQLTRRSQPHEPLAQPAERVAQAAHDVWEMEAYGTVLVPTVGQISLINLTDRFSHVKLLSFPVWVGAERISRHADTDDYLLAWRLACVLWGLPRQLWVDRDSIYFDSTCPSPYPTRLHLLLLGLGVELVIGPPHAPRQRAQVERVHQTWAAQVLVGQHFADWSALWHALQATVDFLNCQLPCRGTDNLPPLVAHPQAATPRRPYDPLAEPTLFDPARIEAYLALGCWFRQASNVGVISLGDLHYTLGKAWAKHQIKITYEPSDHCLVFVDHDGQFIRRLPIKGLTYAELAGDMGRLFELHPYQLALPFTWPEQRVARLSEILGGTT